MAPTEISILPSAVGVNRAVYTVLLTAVNALKDPGPEIVTLPKPKLLVAILLVNVIVAVSP